MELQVSFNIKNAGERSELKTMIFSLLRGDYNDWFDTRSVEHILDISSSNSNYPTNSERIFCQFQDMQELISRYDPLRGWTGNEDAGALYGNAWWSISFSNPVLCENNDYVRLYKNGDTTHITNERIGVIGYY